MFNNDGKIGLVAMLTPQDKVILQSHIRRLRLKKEAIEKYKAQKFDLVILDLSIRGGKDGIETFNSLYAYDQYVKAMVVSGHAHNPIVLDPESHGLYGSLVKPFRMENLQETVTSILDQK